MAHRVLALPLLLLFLAPAIARSQASPSLRPHAAEAADSLPPPRHIHDSRYGVSFDLPAGWNVTEKDGDVSTFSLDARTAGPSTRMRDVAQLAFNPFPASTFAGALFYFSVIPRTTAPACAHDVTAQAPHTVSSTTIAGLPFTEGYDQHGTICTEARDHIYTTFSRGTCLRFDLVLNTFCGGDVSGVRNISDREVDAVQKRLLSVLNTIHLDPAPAKPTR